MTTHNTFYISRNKTKIDQTEVELYLEKTVLVPKLFANYTEVVRNVQGQFWYTDALRQAAPLNWGDIP